MMINRGFPFELGWDKARHASRAAWDRVCQQIGLLLARRGVRQSSVTNLVDSPSCRGMVVIPIVGPALLGTICFVKDLDARLGADLSLAVVRLARQLRFRRAESPGLEQ